VTAGPRAGGSQPRSALACGVLHVVGATLPGFLTASLATRIDADFAFGPSALGLAVAVIYIACAVASSPAGHLVERLGGRQAMRIAGSGTAACCLGVALLVDSVPALLALLVVGGLANATAVPAASALIDRHVPVRRHNLAFGAMQAGAPFGALAAGLALPLVAIPLGWRWAFAGTAALALATAAAAPATPRAASRREHPGVERPRGVSSVHALAVTAFMASAAGTGLVSFIVVYGVESGLSESGAGVLLGGLSLAAAASRIAVGVATDRAGGDPLRPVAPMLLAGTGGLLLLVSGEPALVVAGALLAGGVGWAWPGALTSAVVGRAPGAPAWAVGVMMSGLFAGAVVGPLATGVLADRELFTEAWLVLAAFALLAAVTVVAVSRGSARRRSAAPPGGRTRG
jgi:MFS family permease